MARSESGGRWAIRAATVIGVVALTAATTWAAITVLTPAEDPTGTKDFTYVTIEDGEVSASLKLNASVTWNSIPSGSNKASGTVTSVAVTPGETVAQGDPLYAVDARPVIIAVGSTPSYRNVEEGLLGEDVRQLQQLLHDLGLFRGAVDGNAGPVTVAAIRSWQKRQGLPDTGVVETGDVIYVPSLPARVILDAEVVNRGSTVVGGEPAVSVLPAVPLFNVAVTESQAERVPAGTEVHVTSPSGAVWTGYTGQSRTDPDTGALWVSLEGVDCGEECAQLNPDGETSLPTEIVTVPAAKGLVAPCAAIVTGVDGRTALMDSNGERHDVAVGAAARGSCIVTGVREHLRVRVPAEAQ